MHTCTGPDVEHAYLLLLPTRHLPELTLRAVRAAVGAAHLIHERVGVAVGRTDAARHAAAVVIDAARAVRAAQCVARPDGRRTCHKPTDRPQLS